MRKKKSDKGEPTTIESYFDWKLNFKKVNQPTTTNKNKEKTKNALGLSEGEFKKYLKKWKKGNL